MSISPDTAPAAAAKSDTRLDAALDRVTAALGVDDAGISAEALALLLTQATRCYVQRLQQGEYFSPFHPDIEVTATEAMILSTEVLKSADLQLFELGMWQSMGSPT